MNLIALDGPLGVHLCAPTGKCEEFCRTCTYTIEKFVLKPDQDVKFSSDNMELGFYLYGFGLTLSSTVLIYVYILRTTRYESLEVKESIFLFEREVRNFL